jgi:hypothetical protein
MNLSEYGYMDGPEAELADVEKALGKYRDGWAAPSLAIVALATEKEHLESQVQNLTDTLAEARDNLRDKNAEVERLRAALKLSEAVCRSVVAFDCLPTRTMKDDPDARAFYDALEDWTKSVITPAVVD